jgi:hypothetical protein
MYGLHTAKKLVLVGAAVCPLHSVILYFDSKNICNTTILIAEYGLYFIHAYSQNTSKISLNKKICSQT